MPVKKGLDGTLNTEFDNPRLISTRSFSFILWGLVTHIGIGNLTIIGSDNGLQMSSGKRRPFCLGLNVITHKNDVCVWFDSWPSARNSFTCHGNTTVMSYANLCWNRFEILIKANEISNLKHNGNSLLKWTLTSVSEMVAWKTWFHLNSLFPCHDGFCVTVIEIAIPLSLLLSVSYLEMFIETECNWKKNTVFS